MMAEPNTEWLRYRRNLQERIGTLDDLVRFPGGERLLVITARRGAANLALSQNGRMLCNLHQGLWTINGYDQAVAYVKSNPTLFALGAVPESLQKYAARAQGTLLELLEKTA